MSEKYPLQSGVTCLMEGRYCPLYKLGSPNYAIFTIIVFHNFCSYEDWGVDELIVEDSWKRQVGGD